MAHNLRNGSRVDYKLLHHGDGIQYESHTKLCKDGADRGESGFSPVREEKPGLPSCFPESDPESGDDAETAEMLNELEQLKREKQALQKEKEKQCLRQELQKARKEVSDLKGLSLPHSHLSLKTTNTSRALQNEDTCITLKDLRQSNALKKKVVRQVKHLGLLDSDSHTNSDSSDSSDTDSFSDATDGDNSSVHCNMLKKSKTQIHSKKKSGICRKSSDKVKHRQNYPHSQLRYEFVSQHVSFESLDLNLFVAGELETISNTQIKSIEHRGRIALLKRIMYLNTSHDFKSLKSYYAAVLREIELGEKDWSDDFT